MLQRNLPTKPLRKWSLVKVGTTLPAATMTGGGKVPGREARGLT